MYRIQKGYDVIPYIYNEMEKELKDKSLETKMIAKVNKLIYYYHYDKEQFETEIKSFDTSALKEDFKLAEAILKEDEEKEIEYLEALLYNDEAEVFRLYDLPLIHIAINNHETVKDLFKTKFSNILGDGSVVHEDEPN